MTGRILPELQQVFPRPRRVRHRRRRERRAALLAESPATCARSPRRRRRPLWRSSKRAGVGPIQCGHCIVATWTPHEVTVLETIKDMGLELSIIFNKGAVMILPTGVNKASGLVAALAGTRRGAPPRGHRRRRRGERSGVPQGLLASASRSPTPCRACEPKATCCNPGDHGAAVRELIERRPLGRREYDGGHGMIERLGAAAYQCLIVDPEGDDGGLDGFVTLGDVDRAPRVEEVVDLVRADGQVVVNLLDVAMDERPRFASALLAALGELRAASGRPHWIVIDEAHHLIPAQNHNVAVPAVHWECVLLVTTDPALVAPTAFTGVDHVVALGEGPSAMLADGAFAYAAIDGYAAGHLAEDDRGVHVYWRRPAAAAAREQLQMFLRMADGVR